MKTNLIFFATLLALITISACKQEPKQEPLQKTDISEFLGQWTIDIDGGSVGWLEVRQEDKYLDGDILWGGGSVLPVSAIFLEKDHVLVVQRANDVVRSRDENNNPVKKQVVTQLAGDCKKTGIKIDEFFYLPAVTD